jgi:hypothetical protein
MNPTQTVFHLEHLKLKQLFFASNRKQINFPRKIPRIRNTDGKRSKDPEPDPQGDKL